MGKLWIWSFCRRWAKFRWFAVNHRFPWGADFGGGKVNGWLQEKKVFCFLFGGGGSWSLSRWIAGWVVLTNYDHRESEGRGKRRESPGSAIFGSLEAAKGWWEGARKRSMLVFISARAVVELERWSEKEWVLFFQFVCFHFGFRITRVRVPFYTVLEFGFGFGHRQMFDCAHLWSIMNVGWVCVGSHPNAIDAE